MADVFLVFVTLEVLRCSEKFRVMQEGLHHSELHCSELSSCSSAANQQRFIDRLLDCDAAQQQIKPLKDSPSYRKHKILCFEK